MPTEAVQPSSTQVPTSTMVEPIPTMISEKDSMVLVYVPEGEFLMGSPLGEVGRQENLSPGGAVFDNA